MKKPQLILALALAQFFLAGQSEKTIQTIKAFEASRCEALVKNDLPTLEKLLAAELVYTHSNAAVENKAEYLEALRSRKYIFKSFSTDSTDYRFLKKRIVVATGIARMQGFRLEREFNLSARFTAVYVKRKKRWQLLAWQTTRR